MKYRKKPSINIIAVPVESERIEGVAIIHQITSGEKEHRTDEAVNGIVMCSGESRTLQLSRNEVAIWRRGGLGT